MQWFRECDDTDLVYNIDGSHFIYFLDARLA